MNDKQCPNEKKLEFNRTHTNFILLITFFLNLLNLILEQNKTFMQNHRFA